MKCESIMVSLSEQEMVDLWKLKMGYVTPRRDCYLERDDDVVVGELLRQRLREWYATQLLTAPVHLLPVEDVSANCMVAVEADGAVAVTLPGRVVRPVAVQISGWERAATEFHAEGSAAHLRQSVEWLRGTSQHPVAIDCGSVLRLYPGAEGLKPMVLKAQCVVRPADGSYQLAETLLGKLPRE